jgi:hypothetical protein
MNAITKPAPRQRKTPERRCKLTGGTDGARTLTLRVGVEATAYRLEAVAVDDGAGYRLTKPGGETYDAHLDDAGGHSCTCWSHIRWGHRRPCKHIAALLALRQRGRL